MKITNQTGDTRGDRDDSDIGTYDNDPVSKLRVHQLAIQLWDVYWKDSELLLNDVRGKELARQLTRCVNSISSNIEEGYGRGFGKEYPHFLRIARGSARETKGRYFRCRFLLGESLANERVNLTNHIIVLLNKLITAIENKKKL